MWLLNLVVSLFYDIVIAKMSINRISLLTELICMPVRSATHTKPIKNSFLFVYQHQNIRPIIFKMLLEDDGDVRNSFVAHAPPYYSKFCLCLLFDHKFFLLFLFVTLSPICLVSIMKSVLTSFDQSWNNCTAASTYYPIISLFGTSN